MKKNRFFSHDTNAHIHYNFLKMRSKEGNLYYGLYWILIEVLAETDDYRLPLEDCTWEILSKIMYEDVHTIKVFIEKCIHEYDLLEIEDNEFFSRSLIERMNIITKKNDRMKELANLRWEKERNKKVELEEKKLMKKESNKDVNDVVERIWKLYPRKEGKASSVKKIKSLLNKYSEKEICTWIDRYKLKIETEAIDMKYVKTGKTFFNTGYVDFLDENYQEEKQSISTLIEITNENINDFIEKYT